MRSALIGASIFLIIQLGASCSGDDTEPRLDDPNTSGATTSEKQPVSGDQSIPSAPMTTQSPVTPDDDGCHVILFDSEDFDESDSRYLINQPGQYASLAGLPGTDRDWTGEADSIRVGSGSTVTIWPEPDFSGTPVTLPPGTEIPDIEMSEEPASLELRC